MKVEKLNEKVDWKVAMEGNNSNIDRLRNVATQVNIDPVMGEVIRENEESDKMTGDTFKELSKELDGITPKDPDTGKKITMKPYTEKLSLDESLFSEDYSREFSNNVIYSDNKKQEFADFINDLIYRALDNYIPNANSSIEDLPDVSDYSYDSIVKEEKAIANLVRIIVDNYFINSNLGESKSSKKKKHLCESSSDGWNEEVLYDVTYILDKLQNINYEISSCVRGAYSNCKTYSELGKYLEELGNNLSNLGEEISEYGEDSDDEDVDESLKESKKKLSEDWVVEPKAILRTKNGDELTIKDVSFSVDEYSGKVMLKVEYDYVLANGKVGHNVCYGDDISYILKGKLSVDEEPEIDESMSLKEYVDEDEVEEDEYTVYDLLNDRLFGYGINKSNFRQKWKFAEVEPTVKTSSGKLKRGYFYPTIHADELVTGKPDDRRAFVDGGVGVFVHDDEEATLAKKCAEELKLDFDMKKLVRPVNGFNYIAVIKVPDEIQEMPVKDYVESIGKSMKDFLRGRGEKPKADFTGSANYSSRKANKESEE